MTIVYIVVSECSIPSYGSTNTCYIILGCYTDERTAILKALEENKTESFEDYIEEFLECEDHTTKFIRKKTVRTYNKYKNSKLEDLPTKKLKKYLESQYDISYLRNPEPPSCNPMYNCTRVIYEELQ